jgi:poly-beta-1,6-N-acetyl-D-glucosamine synthase
MDWPTLLEVLRAIDHSVVYMPILFFYGFYPIAMAGVWVIMSVSYFRRRERAAPPPPGDYFPFVSVVIPAYGEEETIGPTLDALLRVDYPDWEVIVVSDGSPDGTVEVVRRYLATGRVRLLDKQVNEGKAMALNDAIPLCRGEIVVTLDADIIVTPGVLRALVPHFLASRTGAVTGNPRVSNRGSVLRNLQTLEFTSIVSVQRRAQRVWGRVLTVSGAIAAFRKTAVVEVGGFSPDMATEDIEMTWKLQCAFWDVRYEASAVVWMQVPPTLRELWKQRRRWTRGLTQVLMKYRSVPTRWVWRRLWPVYYEGILSILWAYAFVLVSAYWTVCGMAGYTPYGATPIPNLWGMAIATACMVQIGTGVLLDRRYDPTIVKYYPMAVLYPLIYWMLMSSITAIYTLDAIFRRPPRLQTWNIQRAQ